MNYKEDCTVGNASNIVKTEVEFSFSDARFLFCTLFSILLANIMKHFQFSLGELPTEE